MRSVTVNIPDNLGLNENELLIYFAAKLYEDGKLSSGQAAEFAGLSKRTFIELLGKYGISLFNYTTEDLDNDIKDAGFRISKNIENELLKLSGESTDIL
jgi:predicted HTH domain antitoxin